MNDFWLLVSILLNGVSCKRHLLGRRRLVLLDCRRHRCRRRNSRLVFRRKRDRLVLAPFLQLQQQTLLVENGGVDLPLLPLDLFQLLEPLLFELTSGGNDDRTTDDSSLTPKILVKDANN